MNKNELFTELGFIESNIVALIEQLKYLRKRKTVLIDTINNLQDDNKSVYSGNGTECVDGEGETK